jgi:protoporphyrinogen oxidase
VKRIEARSSVPLSVRVKVFYKLVRGLARTALGKNLRKVLYPRGGMGALPLALARRFEEAGGKLVLDAGEVRLGRSGDRIDAVRAGDTLIQDPETVIWTGSIHELLAQLGMISPNLPFVPILLGFVKIKRRLDLPHYLYTYYAQPDLVFNRAYFPRLITEGLVPEGRDAICLEVSPHGGHDEAYYREAMLDGLEKSGLCRREEVESLEVLEVPDAYPVYPLDYYETLQSLWKEMGMVENLWSIGRSAQFYYNNVARSMSVSLDLAEHLLRPATPGAVDR